jgi:hypothetical protein
VLREAQRLRLFQNRVLRKFFWLRGRKEEEDGENFIMSNFIMFTPH